MSRLSRMCIGCAIVAGLGSTAAAGQVAMPTSSAGSASSTYWGVTVRDPYRGLEDATSPQTRGWIRAQNAYADSIISAIGQGPALAQRIRHLAITGVQQFGPRLAGSTLFYMRETPPQAQPVLVAQRWPNGAPRVLVDTNTSGGLTAINDFWPSPDGKYVAYGTSSAGTEDETIRVVQTASGRSLADALPRAGGGTTPADLVWDAGDAGFVHTRLPLRGTVPDSQLGFNVVLFHHALSTPASADKPAFGQGLSRVAEYALYSSDDGSRAAAVVHYGDGSNNYVYERDAGSWHRVATPRDGIPSWDSGSVAFDGNRLLAIATTGSLRGRIVAISAAGLRTLVPMGAWAMRSIAPIAGGFLITEVWGPDWRVRQFDERGGFVRTLALPDHGIGVGAIASDARSTDAIVTFQGWTIPQRWARFDSKNGTLATIYSLKPSGDYSGIVAERLDATASDGTRVPVTVVHERAVRANGSAPTILTAYGAYGLTTAPFFVGAGLAWLERGGIIAAANIRGGGEFGEGWHQAGALLQEQHRFDDLIASGRALVQSRWTTSARLGITGGSAGGLLMGGALTQSPQLFRAVVSFVGIYDVLRVELTPNGAFNVTEFGTVTKPDQFRAMYAYSPYHRVRDGTEYPAVLLITGENDPRVAPWESWKMAARLQAASSSSRPIIVLTRSEAGHGIGASFSQRLGNAAAECIFFAGQLGLK